MATVGVNHCDGRDEHETKLTSGFVPPGITAEGMAKALSWLDFGWTGIGEQDMFTMFCAKVRGLEPEVAAKQRILNLGGVSALGLCDLRSAILLRNCYFELEAQIVSRSHAILGTPSIGKTMFMTFCL